MNRIDPKILRQLREQKGWSQETLSEATQFGRSGRIDKQTISRLERGLSIRTHERTRAQLARALNVEPAVLSGASPPPEMRAPNEYIQLKLQFDPEHRNALDLAASRYNVAQYQIMDLAPFLFCWAAEASLRDRRVKIEALAETRARTHAVQQQVGHFPELDPTDLDVLIDKERVSIGCRDLFGSSVFDEPDVPLPDLNAENPFSAFLVSLAAEFEDVLAFERIDIFESPEYRVCREEALHLVGGDADRAEELLGGRALLCELPDEIAVGKFEKNKERAEWVRLKAEEYLESIRARIEATVERRKLQNGKS